MSECDPMMEREAEEEELQERRASADAEMQALEARGRRAAALEARGICQHGHRQGKSANNRELWDSKIPHSWDSLAIGDEVCLRCHEVIKADDPRNWNSQRKAF